jgi:hypothetical protein
MPFCQPLRTLVAPDAPMKTAAEKHAALDGHRLAVAVRMVTGFAPASWSEIKNPSWPCPASAGSPEAYSDSLH